MSAKAELLLILFLLHPLMLQTVGYKLDKKRAIVQPSLVYNEGMDGCAKEERCSMKLPLNAGTKQKASGIALKAAQEAKAASDAQIPASENAALQVKIQLADKALAAANAAEAALASKLEILQQLESEVREGELMVAKETGSLQSSEGNCNAALQAATQAGRQLKMLSEAVRNAQSNVINSEQAASGAQQELIEKQQLVEAAKKRVELLHRQLDAVRADFTSTKKAAERAARAAQEARQRASRERRKAQMRIALPRQSPQ